MGSDLKYRQRKYAIKLQRTETEFNCGIDLHARSMYICVMDREGNILVHRNVRYNVTVQRAPSGR